MLGLDRWDVGQSGGGRLTQYQTMRLRSSYAERPYGAALRVIRARLVDPVTVEGEAVTETALGCQRVEDKGEEGPCCCPDNVDVRGVGENDQGAGGIVNCVAMFATGNAISRVLEYPGVVDETEQVPVVRRRYWYGSSPSWLSRRHRRGVGTHERRCPTPARWQSGPAREPYPGEPPPTRGDC